MKEVTINGIIYTQQCTNKFCTKTPIEHVKATITLNNPTKEVTIEAVEGNSCNNCIFYDCCTNTIKLDIDNIGVIECIDDGYIYKIKEK